MCYPFLVDRIKKKKIHRFEDTYEFNMNRKIRFLTNKDS